MINDLLALRGMRNDAQAQSISASGNRSDRQGEQVNTPATHFACDIAVQLKHPTCSDGLEDVQQHPQGGEIQPKNIVLRKICLVPNNTELKKVNVMIIRWIFVL